MRTGEDVIFVGELGGEVKKDEITVKVTPSKVSQTKETGPRDIFTEDIQFDLSLMFDELVMNITGGSGTAEGSGRSME